MRLLTLGTVVALSGCSLIRTSTPEPVGSWSKRSECNDSAGPPVIDGVLAGVGAFGVAAGGLAVAQPPDANGNSSAGSGVLLIASGISVAAFFATSAIIGTRRVHACSVELAEWDRAHPNDPDRPLSGERREQLLARRYLECPIGELTTEDVSFGRNNKWADPYRWGQFQISGCGKMTWCGEVDNRINCQRPPDMALATQQLSVETGCAEASIVQLQRFAAVAHQGRNELVGQATYRLDACGQQFSCTVPLFAPYDNETPVPVLRDGGQLVCKPVSAGVPAALPMQLIPPPPPPPPPNN